MTYMHYKYGIKYQRLQEISKLEKFSELIPKMYPMSKEEVVQLSFDMLREVFDEVENSIGVLPWIIRSSGDEDDVEINAGKYISLACYRKEDLISKIFAVANCLPSEGVIDVFIQSLIVSEFDAGRQDLLSPSAAPLFLNMDINYLIDILASLHKYFDYFQAMDCEWCIHTDFGVVSATSNTVFVNNEIFGEINLGFGFFSAQKNNGKAVSSTYIIHNTSTNIWCGENLIEVRSKRVYLVQVRPVDYSFQYPISYYLCPDEAVVDLRIKQTIVGISDLLPGEFLYSVTLEDAWNRFQILGNSSIKYFFVEEGAPLEHAALMCRHRSIAVYILDSHSDAFSGFHFCNVDPDKRRVSFYSEKPHAKIKNQTFGYSICMDSIFTGELNDVRYKFDSLSIPISVQEDIIRNSLESNVRIYCFDRLSVKIPSGISSLFYKNNLNIPQGECTGSALCKILSHSGLSINNSCIEGKENYIHFMTLFESLISLFQNEFLSEKERESYVPQLLSLCCIKDNISILNSAFLPIDIKLAVCKAKVEDEKYRLQILIKLLDEFKKNCFNVDLLEKLKDYFFILTPEKRIDYSGTFVICVQLSFFNVVEFLDLRCKNLLKYIQKNCFIRELQVKLLKVWCEVFSVFDNSLSKECIQWLNDDKNISNVDCDIEVTNYFSEKFCVENILNLHQMQNFLHQKCLYCIKTIEYSAINSLARELIRAVNRNGSSNSLPNFLLTYTDYCIEINIGLSMHKASIRFMHNTIFIEYSEALAAETPTRLIVFQWILKNLSNYQSDLKQRSWIIDDLGTWRLLIEVNLDALNDNQIRERCLWFLNFISLLFDSSYDFSGVYFSELKVNMSFFSDRRWEDFLLMLMKYRNISNQINCTPDLERIFMHLLTWLCLENGLAKFVLQLISQPPSVVKKITILYKKKIENEEVFSKWRMYYTRYLILQLWDDIVKTLNIHDDSFIIHNDIY